MRGQTCQQDLSWLWLFQQRRVLFGARGTTKDLKTENASFFANTAITAAVAACPPGINKTRPWLHSNTHSPRLFRGRRIFIQLSLAS